MKYKVTITEVDEESGKEIERYLQTVDTLDIYAVINAVNSAMPAGNRKQRSDAGKPRKKEDLTTSTWPGKEAA